MKKRNKFTIVVLAFFFTILSCKKEDLNEQLYSTHRPTSHHDAALEVLQSSKKWVKLFNDNDIESLVEIYDENAILKSSQVGITGTRNEIINEGKESICKYWKKIKDTIGSTMFIYDNVKIQVQNDTVVYLSADWKLNVRRGYNYQETWLKKNNVWKIVFDGIFIKPVKTTLDVEDEETDINSHSHDVLFDAINKSKKWIQDFNNKKYNNNAETYSQKAFMYSNPLGLKIGNKEIKSFWKYLIDNGVTNLIYEKPIFEEKNGNMLLSSDWSMNKYNGKIIQENWIKEKGTWILDHDTFWIN